MCFIDIAKDRRILTAPAGNDIHISMFVNDVCYLCISNLGKSSGKLVFQDQWLDRVTGKCAATIEIPAGGMVFLQSSRNEERTHIMVKVIAEVIGIIGIICSILSFQCSQRKMSCSFRCWQV